MRVEIYSRKRIEKLPDGKFPAHTAVISFFDPDRCQTDKSCAPVDYRGKTERVLYVPLDDFQAALPEAKSIAAFVKCAEEDGWNVICQCESGQNRSAGCAAAILQYFYGKGYTVLENDAYFPDQMVYERVLEALEEV